MSSGTPYQIIIVLLSSGAIILIRGGVYTEWTILWATSLIDTLSLFGNLIGGGAGAKTVRMSDLAVFQLYGDFATDYGVATTHIASPTTGATGTMTADGFVNFTWTPVAAETLELDVRRTDDDNRWVIRCDQAGSTIKLIQREGGVETERASAAQTFTAGTAYTIQARAVADVIRNFVNSVAKNTYSSASFNNTATGIKVSGFTTGANLASFPRTLTGDPADEIERQLTWLGL